MHYTIVHQLVQKSGWMHMHTIRLGENIKFSATFQLESDLFETTLILYSHLNKPNY